MNRFWLRRLCEGSLFISGAILVLYMWARFIPTGYTIPLGLAISDITAGIAAVASIISLILCFWLPEKNSKTVASAVYTLTVVQISVLIATSGSLSSPFISTWLMVAIFAGYFGIAISGGMVALLILQVVIAHIQNDTSAPTIITHLFFGLAPIILSFVLWHRQPSKKSDKSLRELASRLSTVEGKSDVVINAIGDGVMAVNKRGVIDLINPSAQAIVGWNKGDALGLDWRSVLRLVGVDGREVSEIDNPISQALANNTTTHNDKLYLNSQSGKKRLLSIVSSPVGSDDGIIVVFRDITKEKVEEREQAEFISTASHEMRTPVASIEGYLGLALNPATANIDDKARDFITKAHESARYLGRLFQDLLDISKAEEGILKNDPKVIDVTATTESIFESLSTLASKKGLRYIYKPNPGLDTDNTSERRLDPVFYSYIDPHHFKEVVLNLIENAIKYTAQGDVTVDVTGDNNVVTVAVKDTGIGIPQEDIPHLFQRFYRVDNTDTREIGGTGLGLFLCRRLAETIGGHLRVESIYHQGSTFYFEVPRMSHSEAMQKLQDMSEELPDIIQDRSALPMQEPDEQNEPRLAHNPGAIATQQQVALNHNPEPGVVAPQSEEPVKNFSPIDVQDLKPSRNYPEQEEDARQENNTEQNEPVQGYPTPTPIPLQQNHSSMTIEELETSYRSVPREEAVLRSARRPREFSYQPTYNTRQSPAPAPQPQDNSHMQIPQ